MSVHCGGVALCTQYIGSRPSWACELKLAVGVAAEIEPKFQLAFDGVYNAQPLPNSNFDGDLDINYNQTIDETITQLIDKYYPPASGWEPPSYPAVNTSVYIPAQTPTYSTYAAATVPSGVISSAGTIMHMGYDIFEDLGLLVIVIPLAILAILWKFTGG